jgi:3-hydroxybutyryl-CoA dehydrogenase
MAIVVFSPSFEYVFTNIKTHKIMFKHLGIVGAGIMGRGIAQIAALAKIDVSIYDVNESILRRSLELIKSDMRKLSVIGKLTPDELSAAVSKLHTRTSLPDLGHCDCIIEAVIEDIRVKKDLFKHLDLNSKSTSVLASTTSSLSITSIATYAQNPQRIIGTNFFSPVSTSELVEVIKGYKTDNETTEQTLAFVKSLGKIPIVVKDSPGFITGRISQPFYNEALRLLSENVANAEQIDRIMKTIGGFPSGPFEKMDETGIDTSLAVTQSLYDQSNGESRLRPNQILKQMVESGLLGKKSGKGFFIYEEEN